MLDWNLARWHAAQRYNDLLNEVKGIVTPHEEIPGQHVYHQYTVQILDDKRDALQHHLKQNGIDTVVYYPVPVHKLPIYGDIDVRLPVAEQAANEVLSLPIWPQIGSDVQVRVVEAIKDFLRPI